MRSVDTFFTVPSLHPFYIYWFSIAAYTVSPGPFTQRTIVQMPQDGKDKAVL